MTFKKTPKNSDAYDKNMNLIGEFDGEFFYSHKGGQLPSYRIDGNKIYTSTLNKVAENIGTFEDGKAILFTGELLFQCEE